MDGCVNMRAHVCGHLEQAGGLTVVFEEIDLRVAKRSVTVAGPVRNPRVEWVCQVDYAQSSDITQHIQRRPNAQETVQTASSWLAGTSAPGDGQNCTHGACSGPPQPVQRAWSTCSAIFHFVGTKKTAVYGHTSRHTAQSMHSSLTMTIGSCLDAIRAR